MRAVLVAIWLVMAMWVVALHAHAQSIISGQQYLGLINGNNSMEAAKKVNYFVIYSHRVVNPNETYAVMCQTPGCDTVYMDQADDMGFETLDEALAFLRNNQNFELIRLVKTIDVPVTVSKEKKVEHHPDTETTEKVYSK